MEELKRRIKELLEEKVRGKKYIIVKCSDVTQWYLEKYGKESIKVYRIGGKPVSPEIERALSELAREGVLEEPFACLYLYRGK